MLGGERSPAAEPARRPLRGAKRARVGSAADSDSIRVGWSPPPFLCRVLPLPLRPFLSPHDFLRALVVYAYAIYNYIHSYIYNGYIYIQACLCLVPQHNLDHEDVPDAARCAHLRVTIRVTDPSLYPSHYPSYIRVTPADAARCTLLRVSMSESLSESLSESCQSMPRDARVSGPVYPRHCPSHYPGHHPSRAG